MPEHAHDEPAPGREPPRIRPPLAEIVERKQASLEAEGRTMADWLDRIVPIPAMEPGWATAAVRELRDSDDIRRPSFEECLRHMDQYRQSGGLTTDEIVEALHEARQEREEQLHDVAAPGAAPRTPRSRHQ